METDVDDKDFPDGDEVMALVANRKPPVQTNRIDVSNNKD